jgi:hypothetical protein
LATGQILARLGGDANEEVRVMKALGLCRCGIGLAIAFVAESPGAVVIQPSGSQDGYILVASGVVETGLPTCIWGKHEGRPVTAVGIHSLPADVKTEKIAGATLRIPRPDIVWSTDESCLRLTMVVKHIAAADISAVTLGDGTSASLGDIGLYRPAGPYAADNARFVDFNVMPMVKADLAAGRKAFAWRIEPGAVGDKLSSQRYFPSVENKDAAFPAENRGARLILRLVGESADAPAQATAERGTEARSPAPKEFAAVLAAAGKPQCTLVIADQAAFMEQKAAQEIARVIRRDSGAEVTLKRWSELGASPSGTFVVLGTPQSVPLIGQLTNELGDGIGELPLAGPDAYAVQTTEREQAKYLVVAGTTPRAVFYGAVYVGEQILTPQRADASPAHGAAGPNAALSTELPKASQGEAIVVTATKVVRVPALAERAPYTLGFIGIQPEYRLDDWKVILDGMAREGINRVYYWWQSLYKPKDFPDRRNIDGGTARIKMTNDDVNELARYAHKLGMKFLLGGGAFSWGGAAALTDVYPETAAKGASGMCPSHPKARELQLRFSLEMLESIPEADGIWFEPRDEHGECKCDVCQKPVDSFGSKQYGQSEIGWLTQFAKALWQKRPDAEIGWLIELYQPSKMHSEDPAYFAKIRQIKDPRIQWIVVWGAWQFPGPDGKYRPNTFFSRQNVWWNKPYVMSIEDIRTETLKAADMGLLGFSPAFEMCFSVDYYGGAIPYPMDLLPYELTSYAFREFCWDPAQTIDEFKAKMRRRYFGPAAPMDFVDDLIYLRQFAIVGGWANNRAILLTQMAGEFINYDGKPLPKQDVAGVLQAVKGYNESDKKNALDRLEKRLKELQQIYAEDVPKMAKIEARLNDLEPTASRREKSSFALMRRFIADTRRLLDKIGLDEVKIQQALTDITALRGPKG